MPLFIVENDITKMNTDCIVISADVSLKPTGGMSTALYDSVTEPKNLAKECQRIGFCGGCECVTTRSHGLPSQYVIHSVAPIYADSKNRAKEYLTTCYKNAIFMARRKMFESLSVPLIGTGKKGYSKAMSLEIAVQVITEFLNKYDMNINLVIHNKSSFKPNQQLIEGINCYLRNNCKNDNTVVLESLDNFTTSFSYNNSFTDSSITFFGAEVKPESEASAKVLTSQEVDVQSVNFPAILKKVMKKSKIKDSKLYRNANIEKFAFNRLKTNEDKTPDKEVVLALVIAMQMSVNEAETFVAESGYELSNSNKRDIIVRYFLEEQIYNIHTVNQVLFYFDEKQLGALI